MSARVTSSRFIGRAGELAEFEAALLEADRGAPSVLALGGDSGVGKTRLLRGFEAAAPETLFLRGECVEIADGELPYAPLIGALRELARCGDPALERLSPAARGMLGVLLPGLGEPAAGERDDEGAQLRLFEALLELLDRLGDSRPVVLAIEDLHWADRSTRAFTAFLARSLRSERVLFVFTYRSDELHRRHPLLALLSELDHGQRTRRLQLSPWGRGELEQALTDILGAPPGAELIERLYERAEGNPLYTEELLAAGLDGQGAAPQSLRDAFLLRLERLSPPAQAALRVLAVAVSADEELICSLAGLEPEALTQALREALAGHLIETAPDGRFSFRHALLREVAYEDLLPGERSGLHLGLARELAQREPAARRGAAVAAQIAAHAHAAGDHRLTLTAAIAAAAEASPIHAHGEAAELLERALESWPRVEGPQELSGIDHVELLIRAAGAHEHDQQRPRAEAMLMQALEELDLDGDPERAAEVLLGLARARWALARGDEALATARRALELLPVGLADAKRAAVLTWLARTTCLRGRYNEAIGAATEALTAVRTSGAGAELESQLLNTLGMALVGSGATEEGIERLRAALGLALSHHYDYGTESAYTNLADVLLLAGRTGEALETALEGYRTVEPHSPGTHLWAASEVAECAFAAGRWELTRSSLEQDDRALEGRWLVNARIHRAQLALGVGELDSARRDLDEIEPLVIRSLEPQFHAYYGLARCELERRTGDLQAARGAIEQALDRIELCTDDTRRVTAIAAAGVAVEADLAVRARDRGDERALGEAELLGRLHGARLESAAAGGGDVEQAWATSAAAELGRLAGEDDPALWRAAVEVWERIERPYLAARTRLRQGEAELERGRREEAAVTLAGAHAGAEELGARWLVADIEALCSRARLTLAEPVAASAQSETTTAGDPFGLTPREHEVLLLVARGATNREIGGELFMAEKTASVHVSRILAKLDVRTRTQAAAVAHRAGLIPDQPA